MNMFSQSFDISPSGMLESGRARFLALISAFSDNPSGNNRGLLIQKFSESRVESQRFGCIPLMIGQTCRFVTTYFVLHVVEERFFFPTGFWSRASMEFLAKVCAPLWLGDGSECLALLGNHPRREDGWEDLDLALVLAQILAFLDSPIDNSHQQNLSLSRLRSFLKENLREFNHNKYTRPSYYRDQWRGTRTWWWTPIHRHRRQFGCMVCRMPGLQK